MAENSKTKTMLVESRVLSDIQAGSFEQIVSDLDLMVHENEDRFGGSAILLASFVDNVVVLNEQGEFFSVPYKSKNGKLVLSEDITRIDVPVLSEGDVAERGVESFFEGDSFSSCLKKLALTEQVNNVISFDDLREHVAAVFDEPRLWRSFIEDHHDVVARYAWDADFGSLKLKIHPIYEDIFILDDGELEEHREDISSMLFGLESRFRDLADEVRDAIDRDQLNDDEGEMSEEVESFVEFSADYVDHLDKVIGFLSEEVNMAKNGCVMCSAFVHDEVARRYRNYELGGRFIRKVVSELGDL